MDLIVLIPSVLGNLFLGLLVYIKSPKSWTNRLFSALAISIVLLLIANYFSIALKDPALILNAIRLTMFSASLLCYFYLLFVLTFPNQKIPLKSLHIFILTSLTIVTMITDISPFLFTKLEIRESNVQPIPGPGIPLFVIVSIGSIIFSVFTLYRKKLKSIGAEKLQVNLILLGTATMFSLILLTVFLPVNVFNFTAFVPLTPIYTLIFVGATAYAIVKHRLLDIRAVVARTIAYVSLATFLFIFYVLASIAITTVLLRDETNLQQLAIFSALTIFIGYTFQPLRRVFTNITDKIFFKEDYDSNGLLSGLTRIMAEAILIDDIAHRLLSKIISEMRITRGAFVLTDAGKIFVTETQGYKEEPKFSEKDIFSLQALDKNLIFEDLEESPTKELLRRLNITVVIPLKTQVDHVGLFLLGEKASGEIYSEKDLKVLEIFAPEAAISFENAKSVEKIRRFNITLKEQVERATRDLRDANEQLKDLDKLKDEFLSIASHDLRTPMTAIKGYLWMAINGRAGDIGNPALKRYLDISYASSERMISLINDLLNVSRIKAGRMQMVFEDIDFKSIVDQVFAELASKSTEKSIELKYDGPKDLPHVIADKQKMAEVLQNLIGNSLKFTPEKGKITVKAKPSSEKGFVEIAVSDTGVGLSKEDAAKLFEKFGRVEQSYKSAKTSGGTGLGLYITKNYTEMHGGKIWVTSELGKGTTFTFTLKIFDKGLMETMNEENQKKQGTAAIPQTNTSMAKSAVATTVK
jgi:signal transduction histidine kinase